MFLLNFLTLFCISLFSSNLALAEEVPVILWNIKGTSLHIKPVSALGKEDILSESLKDVLKNDANILVFAMNRLSLEDFSPSEKSLASNNTLQNLQSFLDAQRYMMSSVEDPLSQIHKSHCGVQEIVVDQSMDANVLQSISLAFDTSCIVILHISDSGIVGVKDPSSEDIRKIFQPAFDKTSKDVVGIFTGAKSSWGSSNEEHYMFRKILVANETTANFLNVSCFKVYMDGAMLKQKEGQETTVIPLTVPPTVKDSSCDNVTGILPLNFVPKNGTYKSVVVKFNFTKTGLSWIAAATLGLDDGEPINLHAKAFTAPIGYSYSCGDFDLVTENYTISFERFQIQPFNTNDVFDESFDCVTWFTIPIWMGIFVSILFVLIVNCGVYALFSVHTMDRFDDPKGKTISVGVIAD